MMLRRYLRIFGRVLLIALLLLWIGSTFATPAARSTVTALKTQHAILKGNPPGDMTPTQARLDEAARRPAQAGQTNIAVTGQVSKRIVPPYLRDFDRLPR
ncbi:MAG: hypothetical protein LBQ62_08405 [Candidatus Accumulibacter sp.]|jgi:hypothetical protein|nr:hypothetical protein [Accumulibacter sp.]